MFPRRDSQESDHTCSFNIWSLTCVIFLVCAKPPGYNLLVSRRRSCRSHVLHVACMILATILQMLTFVSGIFTARHMIRELYHTNNFREASRRFKQVRNNGQCYFPNGTRSRKRIILKHKALSLGRHRPHAHKLSVTLIQGQRINVMLDVSRIFCETKGFV